MESEACAGRRQHGQHALQWITSKFASLFRPLGYGGLGRELHSQDRKGEMENMKVRESVEVIPAQNGKYVTKIVTASGVVGIFASDVPLAAIEGLHRKLLARLKKLNQAAQSPSPVNPTRRPGP